MTEATSAATTTRARRDMRTSSARDGLDGPSGWLAARFAGARRAGGRATWSGSACRRRARSPVCDLRRGDRTRGRARASRTPQHGADRDDVHEPRPGFEERRACAIADQPREEAAEALAVL